MPSRKSGKNYEKDGVIYRPCSGPCGLHLTLDNFYVLSKPQRDGSPKHKPYCKKCDHIMSTKYWRIHKDRAKAYRITRNRPKPQPVPLRPVPVRSTRTVAEVLADSQFRKYAQE